MRKVIVVAIMLAAATSLFAQEADATTGATSAEGDQAPSTFLGFPSKTAFHMASGYTSSALFLGAGIVGAVQLGTLIQASHEYRDLMGIDEDEISAQCADYISALRDDPLHRALRWTHVGLMSAGEALYLANAITGDHHADGGQSVGRPRRTSTVSRSLHARDADDRRYRALHRLEHLPRPRRSLVRRRRRHRAHGGRRRDTGPDAWGRASTSTSSSASGAGRRGRARRRGCCRIRPPGASPCGSGSGTAPGTAGTRGS